MPKSGYTSCACRDCFEIAVSNDMENLAYCWACTEAGCEDYQTTEGMSKECQVEPEPEEEDEDGEQQASENRR